MDRVDSNVHSHTQFQDLLVITDDTEPEQILQQMCFAGLSRTSALLLYTYLEITPVVILIPKNMKNMYFLSFSNIDML